METISCLWIQKNLDDISNECITSWLNLGYNVTIYTYALPLSFSICNKICRNNNIKIVDANTILEYEEKEHLPLADLFRFNLLSKSSKCVWVDTDLFLLKQLPLTNFVSSEHANQKGAFVPKDRTKTANIGIISQLSGHLLDWDKIIDKINKCNTKQNSNNNNFMKIYQKEMHKRMQLVAEPHLYCPIPWSFAKELYTMNDIIGSKYGVNCLGIEHILQNSIGIHLWRNLLTTKKFNIKDTSVYNKIINRNNKPNYKICIPSYNRLDGIKKTTLNLLKKYNIDNVYIFVSTKKDYDDYTGLGNIILVPEEHKGIGAVRSWIINDWTDDKDNIVFIDDDIELIKTKECLEVDLNILIKDFFIKLIETDLYFGGLPLCANAYFLKNKWTTTLKYISGAIQFIRVDKSRYKIETTLRHYEDYYFDIMYFKRDKGILRWNGCSPITKNYNIVGGICDEVGGLDNRLKDSEAIADSIIDKFGNKCVNKYFKKKTGRGPATWNLRLNHHFKFP
tara:strand:- start:1902 stop:3422 length:1521 start_codon:yes stop_codon:yes gene_type:complete